MWFLLACTTPAPVEPAQPDILLISLDTTRADALSCYGNPRPTTPNLDALAATGARFAWALAPAPSTLSSHATVFTGMDPHGTEVVRNGYPLRDTDTLTERLAGVGYDTMAILGSSALAKPMRMDQGFRVWDQTFSVKRIQRYEATATEVTDRALRHLAERETGKPVFLFAHYYDAHSPFDAPEPYAHRWSAPGMAGRFEARQGVLKDLANQIRAGIHRPADLAEVVATYHGEVSYVDSEVGRLLASVRQNTIVVVFGDHGEMFGEDRQRPFGHGTDLDLPISHVPLIVRAPSVPATVVTAAVGIQDLASTVLDVAGVQGQVGGRESLAAYWEGTPAPREWFLEATQPAPAAGSTGWNNIATERGLLTANRLLLRAPWEHGEPVLYAVAEGQPPVDDLAVRDDLAAKLRAWDAAAPPFREVTVSDTTRDALKALGYVE